MRSRPIPEPVLRDLAERAAAAGLSRRSFLGLLGAAGGAAALTACGNDAASADIRWGNWPLYLDVDDAGNTHPTLDRFVEASGLTVDYLEDVEDCDQFFAKVQKLLAKGKDIGYDVVTLTDWMVERWVRSGYTQKLDRAVMPNTKNIMESLASAEYDEDRSHSVPWQAGLTGIAWRWDKVPGGIKEFNDLWDPKYKGKVEVLTEFTNTLGLALWANGVNPSSLWGDDEFSKALEDVAKQRRSGQIRTVRGNSYAEDLISGDAWVAVAYSGDIFQKNQEEKKNPDDPDLLGFAVPESGGVIWADHFMVPTPSKKREEVQKLINFYYDPVVAAEVAAYVNYITPVVGAQEAMEKVAPELVEDPLVFPDDKTLDMCPLVRGFSSDEYQDYTERFLTELTGT